MLYELYEAQRALLSPFSEFASAAIRWANGLCVNGDSGCRYRRDEALANSENGLSSAR